MSSRQSVLATVKALRPFDSLEAEQIDWTLDWINSGAALYRTEKPATPPIHLVAYAFFFDNVRKEILLTDHIKSGLWLPPGGHVEVDEDPAQSAVREAQEELCLEEPRLTTPNPHFLTVTQTVGECAPHTDVSLWYLFKAPQYAITAFDEREFRQIRWFHVDELPYPRCEPQLQRAVSKLAAMSFRPGKTLAL